MVNPQALTSDSVWLNQSKYEEAESLYQAALAGTAVSRGGGLASNLVTEIVEARQKIQAALTTPGGTGTVDAAVLDRLSLLENENKDLKKVTEDLRKLVLKLDSRVNSLEKGAGIVGGCTTTTTTTASAAADDDDDDDEDDDFELFDDDPDAAAEAEKVRAERVAQYKEKKSKKPALIAKSSLLIDVKPWDDETDMKEIEKCVRTIVMDGLLWGTSKLVPVGYGIKKLQITAVIEDDKVCTDDLEEAIIAFEDYVQSMDIAAFNKI